MAEARSAPPKLMHSGSSGSRSRTFSGAPKGHHGPLQQVPGMARGLS